MDKIKKIWKQSQLALLFAVIIFAIMLIAMLIVFSGMIILTHLGLYSNAEAGRFPMFTFALVSLIVGTVIAFIFSRLPLRPIRRVMDATDKIADGDYSVRLDLKGAEEFRNLSKKFNHMAEELGSVEMLRTDFVNDFSHEFKTPIVSIRGFAKMLKYDDLTEERNEYLDIIVQESERLADLAANILNLSKIEQQTILTDKKRYDLSEQLRIIIAMMDSKWKDKHIQFQLDCDEVYLEGNEELLRQVWINLLDNAIKFSPENGTVKIEICKQNDSVLVSITNQGVPIAPEAASHIFDKFYQADPSRTTKGNGLGLPLVKKIVQLHGGESWLKSSDEQWTVFEVSIPISSTSENFI